MEQSAYFSIIIPVYNVKDYLEKCINSICSQSFHDFECILIDDGSTDGSGELCDKIAQNNTKIKVIHKKNEGVAVARTTGIKNANGKYILFVDSDDILLNEILYKAFESLTKNKSDILIFGYQRCTIEFNEIKVNSPTAYYSVEKMYNENGGMSFTLWNKIYKNELFSTINYDVVKGLTFSEDSYLTLALQRKAKKIDFLSIIGYSYLVRATSVTQTLSLKNYNDRIQSVILMDELYDAQESKPIVFTKMKFQTKYFYIDPAMDYSANSFFQNCKKWRKLFPESNFFYKTEIKTKKQQLYIKLIELHFDVLAYFLYKINKSKKMENFK